MYIFLFIFFRVVIIIIIIIKKDKIKKNHNTFLQGIIYLQKSFLLQLLLKSLKSFGFSKLLFYIFTANPLKVQFLKSSLGIYSMKYGK